MRTILVETASRFALDLIVQETGYEMLKTRGIDLIVVDSPDSFVAGTPTVRLIRQVLGALSEFEKATLVEKLRGARERKRRETCKKVGGRKSYAELAGGLDMVALAKKLHRYPVNGKRRSLNDVADALAEAGYLSTAGNALHQSGSLADVRAEAGREVVRWVAPLRGFPGGGVGWQKGSPPAHEKSSIKYIRTRLANKSRRTV